ncbi:tenascin [Elysia marginata]|uniref:Tenascin n=1 Tax=Elysia marginata TaxID=1093978 RepID=A0AAV4GD09_9GAST|nr:tenascin [Elysia marginata]
MNGPRMHHYELRIDLKVDGQDLFAHYTDFKIEDESNNYRLRLGTYSGTIGEASSGVGFSYSNGHEFSTFDKDNDARIFSDCAVTQQGAWWYGNCHYHYANLNGLWGSKGWGGLIWYTGSESLIADWTEMKIRRI